MSDTAKTKCNSCDREILAKTAERNAGMCKPCHRDSELSDAERFERAVFETIETEVEPFTSYPASLKKLASKPIGYSLCFAFHHVHSEIFNGGVSQLYGNSTWCLILHAITAAETAGLDDVSCTLREIVYYYHRNGRSKLKRKIDDDYFAEIDLNWEKSLQQLDDEYFGLENSLTSVIPTLCAKHSNLFAAENAG